jgi:hypothetical protein
MTQAMIASFLAGAFTLACIAVAGFFWSYWRKTRDRLFAIFALAFALLGLERIVLVAVPEELEGRHFLYLNRLLAFALIIAGVLDKNRPQRRLR